MNKKSMIGEGFKIVILLGIISLLGDIIYEGARSVNGPYLQTLGASATIVGLIAGIGEFLGYGIRLIAGYFSDKTKAYWFFIILGYGLLFTIPMLSLAWVWEIAAVFIITERIGKAIRSPSRDTVLSQTTKKIGTGFVFGLHEFFDQIGAVLGSLLFASFFFVLGNQEKNLSDYQKGYSLLWIPFILLIFLVFVTYNIAKKSGDLEFITKEKHYDKNLSLTFWLYVAFSFFTTIGFISFALVGFHIKANNIVSDAYIPLFYMIAMGVDGVFAIIIGKIYDRLKDKTENEKAGLLALIAIPVLSIFIPFFVFSTETTFIVIGLILWGLVISSHETIMRSAIADITPINKRGTGYGLFTASYGLAIFLGSAFMGILYDYSLILLTITVAIVEAVSIPIFMTMWKSCREESI